MKNSIKCFTVFSLLILIADFSKGQSVNDAAIVLQKCIDLPELQQYYPIDIAGNPKQVYVMQYPTSFPLDIDVSKFDESVMFMSRSEIFEIEIGAYFMFRSFDISQNSAKANINYFYDHNFTANQFKMLSIILELQKVGTEWNVSEISLNGDAK